MYCHHCSLLIVSFVAKMASPLKSFSLYQNNGVTGGDRKDLPVLEKANLPQKCHMSP